MSDGVFSHTGLENIRLPRALKIIREYTFDSCNDLKEIVFDPESALEEIEPWAFEEAGLTTFVAPPSLRKIGEEAFYKCSELRDFRLNDGIRKLGSFCLRGTAVTDVKLPWRVKTDLEELGIVPTDQKVLRIPNKLKVIKDS